MACEADRTRQLDLVRRKAAVTPLPDEPRQSGSGLASCRNSLSSVEASLLSIAAEAHRLAAALAEVEGVGEDDAVRCRAQEVLAACSSLPASLTGRG